MRQPRLKAERWLVIGDCARKESVHERAAFAYHQAAIAFAKAKDLEEAERCARSAAAESDRWGDQLLRLREERERRVGH